MVGVEPSGLVASGEPTALIAAFDEAAEPAFDGAGGAAHSDGGSVVVVEGWLESQASRWSSAAVKIRLAASHPSPDWLTRSAAGMWTTMVARSWSPSLANDSDAIWTRASPIRSSAWRYRPVWGSLGVWAPSRSRVRSTMIPSTPPMVASTRSVSSRHQVRTLGPSGGSEATSSGWS